MFWEKILLTARANIQKILRTPAKEYNQEKETTARKTGRRHGPRISKMVTKRCWATEGLMKRSPEGGWHPCALLGGQVHTCTANYSRHNLCLCCVLFSKKIKGKTKSANKRIEVEYQAELCWCYWHLCMSVWELPRLPDHRLQEALQAGRGIKGEDDKRMKI